MSGGKAELYDSDEHPALPPGPAEELLLRANYQSAAGLGEDATATLRLARELGVEQFPY